MLLQVTPLKDSMASLLGRHVLECLLAHQSLYNTLTFSQVQRFLEFSSRILSEIQGEATELLLVLLPHVCGFLAQVMGMQHSSHSFAGQPSVIWFFVTMKMLLGIYRLPVSSEYIDQILQLVGGSYSGFCLLRFTSHQISRSRASSTTIVMS